jgi:hypothetical protein
MSTLFRGEEPCAACGTVSEFTHIYETTQVELGDLDTRPGEEERSLLRHAIRRCPTCGYCAAKLAELCCDRTALLEYLRAPAYRSALESEGPDTARHFRAAAQLAAMLNRLHDAGWNRLFAAWVEDDRGTPERAAHDRLLAAEAFLAARHARQRYSGDDAGELLILADLQRRAGRFAEAGSAVRHALKMGASGFLKRVLERELALIERNDDRCHKVPADDEPDPTAVN